MLLFEFDEEPLVTKIGALTSQLKTDAADKGAQFTVDDLLDYFQSYDVPLDKTDLYSMIQKPPLKNVIANIQGDQVIFKGQEQPSDVKPTDSEKTVKQMAKHALKK